VLRDRLLFGPSEGHRQSAAIFRAKSRPQTRREEIAKTCACRVALILRIPETSRRLAERIRGIGANKQAARNRQICRSHHVGVTHESAEVPEMRNLQLSFGAIN